LTLFMEFGFIDDASSTTTETWSDATSQSEAFSYRSSQGLRGGALEEWLQPQETFIPSPTNAAPAVQVVPNIIRKYHKPPSQRQSLSSVNTVLINPEIDEEEQSILMPYIPDNEFEGEFPSHILTVENDKKITMSNPQTLTILATVQESPLEAGVEYSQSYSTTMTRTTFTLPSDHREATPSICDSLYDITDTEELVSDHDASSVSWTETDDVELTVHTDDHSDGDHFLTETEKRGAEASIAHPDLKRAPRKSIRTNAKKKKTGVTPMNPRASYSDRRPFIHDYPLNATSLASLEGYSDGTTPMDKLLSKQEEATSPFHGSTPMDRLLEIESLPPIPSKKPMYFQSKPPHESPITDSSRNANSMKLVNVVAESNAKHPQVEKARHDRNFSDVDFSDMLSDDLLNDFNERTCTEVQAEGGNHLTMLINDRKDIRIRVIE